MSSLRLALKQSLEENPQILLSRSREKHQSKKKAKSKNDDSHRRQSTKLKKGRMEFRRKKARTKNSDLESHIKDTVDGGDNEGRHATIHLEDRDDDGSSGLSSSSSSGSSSSSSTSSSSCSSEEDDVGVHRSDTESSSEDSTLDSSGYSSSDSDLSSSVTSESSSDDMDESKGEMDDADREAKELFDADLSEEENRITWADGKPRQKKTYRKRQRRKMKKQSKIRDKSRKNDAANTIQNHWKLKKNTERKSTMSEGEVNRDDHSKYKRKENNTKKAENNSRGSSRFGESCSKQVESDNEGESSVDEKKNSSSKTVEAPKAAVLKWIRNMSEKKQRKNIGVGLRVKVRFVKKSNVNGRITRKLRWYGGVISGTSNSGRRIRIKYDDGTSEISDFPDKDIIVDAENNGHHNNDAGIFIPPTESLDLEDEGGTLGEQDKSGSENERYKENDFQAQSAQSKKECTKESQKEKKYENEGMWEIIKKHENSEHEKSKLFLKDGPSEHTIDKRFSSDVDRKRPSCSKRDVLKYPLVENHSENSHQHPVIEIVISPETPSRSVILAKCSEGTMNTESNSESKQIRDEDGISMQPSKLPKVVENDGYSTKKAVATADEMNLSRDTKSLPDNDSTKSKLYDESTKIESREQHNKTIPISIDLNNSKKSADAFPTNYSVSALSSTLSKSASKNEFLSSGGATCASFAEVLSCDISPKIVTSLSPVGLPLHLAAEDSKTQMFSIADVKDDVNAVNIDDTKREIYLDNAAQHRKNHRPLSIKIALPKRKRTDEDAMLNRRELDSSIEPSFKKTKKIEPDQNDKHQCYPTKKKSGGDIVEGKHLATSVHSYGELLKLPFQLTTENSTNTDSKPFSNDFESMSEGELKEDESRENKTVISRAIGSEPQPSSQTSSKKKPKLSIHISTKFNKVKVLDSSTASLLPQKDGSNLSDQKMNNHSPDLILTKTNEITIKNVDSPHSDQEMGNETNTSSGVDSSPFLNDDFNNSFFLEKSGRIAAKQATEKLKGKKKINDKGNAEEMLTNDATEEDPWVQCDRCQKWRHLPTTVDLDTLPEHWFCELNTYDKKRNNCEAPEQTPKEVAKEKKKAKKLAWKKFQMEQEQTSIECNNKEESKTLDQNETPSPEDFIDGIIEPGSSLKSSSPDYDDDGKNCSKSKSSLIYSSREKNVTDEDEAALSSAIDGDSPKSSQKVKGSRRPGRPRNDDKTKDSTSNDDEDDKKQEWVQCEKCEKWRRLPPRISAEDLPDVWFCSMNTWEINLATCTAIEDKIESATKETFNVQSQIPTSSGSSGKLSYRNLIFGNGRRQKNITERMRAQESLFCTQQDDTDMTSPPTVMYANSDVFVNRRLKKASSFDDDEEKQSIFDIMIHSKAWAELNNREQMLDSKKSAGYHSVGYGKYCQPDGSLSQDTVDCLKAMIYYALGTNVLAAHEVLFEAQCRHWAKVPKKWLELRSLCTIEIVKYTLDQLIKDCSVEKIVDSDNLSLDDIFYRRTLNTDTK